MILAGAWDLRHFAWVTLGGSAAFLSLALALYAYRLGKRTDKYGILETVALLPPGESR